jgi:hypothetical protein
MRQMFSLFNNTISLVSDIVVAISAIIVAILAFWGLNKWRREISGKAKFDLVRQIMRNNSEFENNFLGARNPFTHGGELVGRERKEGESSRETEIMNEWYARFNRLKVVSESLVKLQELGWEAESLLDIESSKQVTETIKIYRNAYASLITSINSYFETRRREITTNNMYRDQEWLTKLHKEIYGLENDERSKEITAAKEKLANVLKKYVR